MRLLSLLLLAAFGTGAHAKLPALHDAGKAKAAETTAKAAWQAKVDAYALCKVQDRVAARAKGNGAKAVQVAAKPASAPSAAGSAPRAGGSSPASTRKLPRRSSPRCPSGFTVTVYDTVTT